MPIIRQLNKLLTLGVTQPSIVPKKQLLRLEKNDGNKLQIQNRLTFVRVRAYRVSNIDHEVKTGMLLALDGWPVTT